MSESEHDASPALCICDLPKDVIYDILARADPRGACALASACRRLRALTSLPGRRWCGAISRAAGGGVATLRPGEVPRPRRGEARGEGTRQSVVLVHARRCGERPAARRARGVARAVRARQPPQLHGKSRGEPPVRVSERDFVFETTLALGGRRFVLRAYSAEPHVEEEDAGTLHPSYGAALCVELEMTAEDDAESGDERSSTRGRNERSSSTAPMSAHLLFQVLRREDRDEDVGASRSAVGASRSAPSLDPLTGVARLVTFQRFDVDDDGGAEILRLSRCVPCSALHSKDGRFVFRDGDDGEETYRLRVAALLHEDEEAADSVPGWRRAGKPRGPADVAGARAPLLELALTSPEMSRRRIALEMYLLWYTMEGG